MGISSFLLHGPQILPKRLLFWFDDKIFPMGSSVSTPGPELMTLCGKVVDPIEGGDYVAQIHFRYSLCFLPADAAWPAVSYAPLAVILSPSWRIVTS